MYAMNAQRLTALLENKRVTKFVMFFLALLLVSWPGAFIHAADTDCQEFAKYGLPGQQGTRLCRKGFLLSHNDERKTPDWVIERVTIERASGTVSRTNRFQPDPDLSPGKRAELSDYRGSGYDRGHMAPAGDMRWDEEAMQQSFYLSNIAPQVGVGMNRGIWKQLEEKVRSWAISRGEVIVFTGPMYTDPSGTGIIGPNEVAVPSHFYKVMYDPVAVEAIAFTMPNADLRGARLEDFLVSVREIESLTGLDFLSKISPPIQELLETARRASLWE